jgi:hypothetical protein
MKISGIYKIQSTIKPERIYIGSSANISKRWKNHIYDLRNNNHHSRKLQRHYNKYGEGDLFFSVLLGCDKADLISIEQYFIDTYFPYFNGRHCARGGNAKGHVPWNKGKKASEDAKRNQSIAHMGHTPWNKGLTGTIPPNRKRVIQYGKNGEKIKEWEYVRQAESELNISHGTIMAALNGRQLSAGGFIWRYPDNN